MKRLILLILLAVGIMFLARRAAVLNAPPQPSTPRPEFRVVEVATRSVRDDPEDVVPAQEGADRTPEWFQGPAVDKVPSGFVGDRVVKGRLSATRERAEADARRQLEKVVARWLAPEVPRSWTVPRPLFEAIIRDRHVEPVASDLKIPDLKDFQVVYVAGYEARFSAELRDQIVSVYNQEIVAKRMSLMGGILGLVLIGLTGLASYIRADEATKGYYTNRLRLLAVAGVGAASVAWYRWLA